jgi:hypothetical protein
MSQLNANPTAKAKASSNVYTALLFIAFVALAAGTATVWYYNVKLTGDLPGQGMNFKNPWFMVPKGQG